MFKGATHTGVSTALSADPIKALAGSRAAQNRLGAVPPKPPPPDAKPPPAAGPVAFPCRHHGKRGTLFIVPTTASPCVAFVREHRHHRPLDSSHCSDDRDGAAEFTVAVNDIREIRKVGGLGWKTKLMVGWSMDREVVDGIDLADRHGAHWQLTAVPMRDELFNRLIALGSQHWLCL